MSASLMGLGIIVVGLRFYARKVQNAAYKLDDWFILPALLCLIVSALCYIIGAVDYELGAPTDNNLPGAADGLSSQIVYGYKVEFITLIIQPWLLGLVKISILFFYRRIFCTGVRKRFSIITATFIGLTVAWALAFFFAVLFSCGTDVPAIWGSFEEFETHCDNTVLLDEIYSIVDFVLDLAVFVMPMPLIWRLQMSIQRRLAVSLVLAVGALTVVASCLRMAIMIIIAQGNGQNIDVLGTNDASLQTATFLYWTMLEQGLAVIVACLPTLRTLFNHASLESVVRSVRTTLSLDSLRSRGSGNLEHSYRSRHAHKSSRSGSEAAITKREDSEVDVERHGEAEYPIPMVPQRGGS
ncbi:hypothetical protein MMC34_001330 [Xylographa carneopallida]|nr:hypothetical protein [Xylographa carneopallida]